VKDKGLPRAPGPLGVHTQGFFLNIARRVIVVIIQARFADSDDARVVRQPQKFNGKAVRHRFRVVRMYADGGKNALPLVGVRQLDRLGAVGNVASDDENAPHAGLGRAPNDSRGVTPQLIGIDVTVRVRK
jgi:hypothetical protein